MKKEKTLRGFGIIRFIDDNNEKFVIQESSAIQKEPLIWLGFSESNIKVRKEDDDGWQNFDIKSIPNIIDVCVRDRLHLSQSKVKEILPVLVFFAEHGYLPVEEDIKE